MPWGKQSDNAATHPLFMRVMAAGPQPVDGGELDPFEAANLVAGIVMRAFNQSALHTEDYFIGDGTLMMLGGPKAQRWIDLAAQAGIWTRDTKDGAPGWKLVEDAEFLHMRSRAEIERDRRRREDSADDKLVAAVRFRDGDECRYCRKPVNWEARRGNRAGTYDHRAIDKPTTPATYVVCCGGCNSSRGKDATAADDWLPLLPPPTDPFYRPKTVAMLRSRGYDVTRSKQRRNTAARTRDAAPNGTPRTSPATPPNATPPTSGTPRARTGHAPDTGPAGSAEPECPPRVGSGRDGTARVGPGSGRDGSGSGGRRRRARRGRPRPPQQHRSSPS